MFKKISLILITTIALTFNVSAGTDGELILNKNKPSEVKDCFEGLNRATFKLNQALDGIIFKPVASVYRKLPSVAKTSPCLLVPTQSSFAAFVFPNTTDSGVSPFLISICLTFDLVLVKSMTLLHISFTVGAVPLPAS